MLLDEGNAPGDASVATEGAVGKKSGFAMTYYCWT